MGDDHEIDGCDIELTEEEAEAGKFLGLVIDTYDDVDDGLQWGTIENPVL